LPLSVRHFPESVPRFRFPVNRGFEPEPSLTEGKKKRQDAADRRRRRAEGADTMSATEAESPLLRIAMVFHGGSACHCRCGFFGVFEKSRRNRKCL